MQSGPVICGLVPNDCEPAATEHARCQTQGILQGPHALHCIALHCIKSRGIRFLQDLPPVLAPHVSLMKLIIVYCLLVHLL